MLNEMNKRLVIFSVLCAFLALPLHGQTSNDIHAKVDGLGADTVYLANYYGSRLFYNDTIVADADGSFSFPGKSFDNCGKHAIVLPGPVFFDFMLVEEPMEFHTSLRNPL